MTLDEATEIMEDQRLDCSSSSSEDCSDDKESPVQNGVSTETSRSIYIQFFLFCFSVLCSISSYSGLIDLQSSINISDALGNRSLMLMSISTVICCLFFSPIVTAAFGAKNTILLSQLCYIVYVLSNFYPAPFILPGGVFLGIAEAFLYTPTLMYCTYFGRKLSRVEGHYVRDSINKFVGYFWGIFQMNEILGNSISTIILNIGKAAPANMTNDHYSDGAPFILKFNTSVLSNLSTSTTYSNSTAANMAISTTGLTQLSQSGSVHDYSMCGANDCYNEHEYEEMHGRYIPMSKAAVHTMLGVYTFLAVIALPIMWKAPSIPKKLKKRKKLDKLDPNQWRKYIHEIWRHFKKTLSQLASCQQLLITPLTLYHGLYISFVSSEVTRAYVSCTVGVEMVGLAMLGGGIVNVLVSFIYAAVSGSNFCRNLLLFMCIVLETLLYLFCLFWDLTEHNSYMGLVVGIVFGFTDGVWSPLIDGRYAEYFPYNEEIAYSVGNLWNYVGSAMMYGSTTLLCVRLKIYIQLATLCLGLVCLCGAEIFYKKQTTSI